MPTNSDAIVSAGPWIVAIVCLALGILNMFGAIKITADESTKFLLGLAVVIGVVLIFRDRLTKVVLPGGITAEISAVKRSVQDVAAATEELKARQTEIAAPKMAILAPSVTTKHAPQMPIEDPEDKNKGQFGREAAKNGLRLSATVQPSDVRPGWFRIDLAVTGLDRKLVDPVACHLHETFNPAVQPVNPINDQARLTVLAWGAFTVGAIADHGNTLLELDLSADTTFPKAFREA
ncbi:pYEATS domain-containing protein [Bradyrhizobium sp. 2TAF36]|uniref:pYEATS domain-containing protein n=1 Tax=Bradyrhizobium sp. 2TAF36 TaxID=3233016 RepID=UPI003F8DD379